MKQPKIVLGFSYRRVTRISLAKPLPFRVPETANPTQSHSWPNDTTRRCVYIRWPSTPVCWFDETPMVRNVIAISNCQSGLNQRDEFLEFSIGICDERRRGFGDLQRERRIQMTQNNLPQL